MMPVQRSEQTWVGRNGLEGRPQSVRSTADCRLCLRADSGGQKGKSGDQGEYQVGQSPVLPPSPSNMVHLFVLLEASSHLGGEANEPL